jgi:hypothetical protein
MPVHDWTRVDAGIFHDFHNAWVIELRNALNGGLLPSGYYALTEQHAGGPIPDVLTLHPTAAGAPPPLPQDSGVATVTKTRPRAQRKLSARALPKIRRKTVAVRHVSGHRIVALLEIVSPANKDRRRSVTEFVNKAIAALQFGVHVTLVDLFPPGRHNPDGMHAALWDRIEPDESYDLPEGQRLTLAAYTAASPLKAWLNHLLVGDALPDTPLFLTASRYIDLPLESTYAAGYAGVPDFWRKVVEGVRPAP